MSLQLRLVPPVPKDTARVIHAAFPDGNPYLGLRDHSVSDWVDRYGRRPDEARLPTAQKDRLAYAGQVGQDGHWLLAAAYDPGSPSWLGEVPAVETLRRVWIQQFTVEAGRVSWRTEASCGLAGTAAAEFRSHLSLEQAALVAAQSSCPRTKQSVDGV